MQQPIGVQKTFKMTSHNLDKITTGKVTLKKTKDSWELSLKAFWIEPINAQMFIVGKTARKVLDIHASEGAFSANRKLSYVMWNDFILQGKMIVVISNDIPILKAIIPPILDMDIHNAMTIIRCGSEDRINAKSKKETIKKEVEQRFMLEQEEDVKHKLEIKSILTLKPYDRKHQIQRKKPAHLAKDSENCLVPIRWSTKEIDKCLLSSTIASPFIGNMNDALFAKIDIADATGFNHMILGKVFMNNTFIYMLCIPGSAYMPPKGLFEYNRWIPAIAGNGYWVKYITVESESQEKMSIQ